MIYSLKDVENNYRRQLVKDSDEELIRYLKTQQTDGVSRKNCAIEELISRYENLCLEIKEIET